VAAWKWLNFLLKMTSHSNFIRTTGLTNQAAFVRPVLQLKMIL